MQKRRSGFRGVFFVPGSLKSWSCPLCRTPRIGRKNNLLVFTPASGHIAFIRFSKIWRSLPFKKTIGINTPRYSGN